MANRVMSPTLLLPASRSIPRKGKGNSRTTMSRNMLVAAWAAHMAKNLLGSFVPHPTHLPFSVGFQFFAMGWQGNSARRKKDRPHIAETTITVQIHFRASRYCGDVVEVVVSAKRRMY